MKVPVWRRALVFLRGIRYVLKMPANKHWKNFGYENFKFNEKVFKHYCDRDASIWSQCKLFKTMVKSVVSASSCSTPTKKRTRESFEVDTPEDAHERSPVKTICLVTSSSGEEDTEEDDKETGGDDKEGGMTGNEVGENDGIEVGENDEGDGGKDAE